MIIPVTPFTWMILQDLFSLGEATTFATLCESVAAHVQVTEENASSWLEWLKNEHGPMAREIPEKVRRAVKRPFDKSDFWADLTDDELATLNEFSQKRRKGKGLKTSL